MERRNDCANKAMPRMYFAWNALGVGSLKYAKRAIFAGTCFYMFSINTKTGLRCVGGPGQLLCVGTLMKNNLLEIERLISEGAFLRLRGINLPLLGSWGQAPGSFRFPSISDIHICLKVEMKVK